MYEYIIGSIYIYIYDIGEKTVRWQYVYMKPVISTRL